MSNNFTFRTAGGRITCLQCNAKSKRTKLRCRAPAAKGKKNADFTGGPQLGPKQNKADSVAPRPKPSTVSKPEQRELNGLKPCVDFVNLKT